MLLTCASFATPITCNARSSSVPSRDRRSSERVLARPNEPRAARAEREAQCNLGRPRVRACQEQVRDVRARDEQHESKRRQYTHDRESDADAADAPRPRELRGLDMKGSDAGRLTPLTIDRRGDCSLESTRASKKNIAAMKVARKRSH